jgi:hypothetical protein
MPPAVALLNSKKSRNTFADFFPKRIFRGFFPKADLSRIFFEEEQRSLVWVAQRLVLRGDEPKKTGACNAQARSAADPTSF